MTSAQCLEFFDPFPLVRIWKWFILQNSAATLSTSAFPWPPLPLQCGHHIFRLSKAPGVQNELMKSGGSLMFCSTNVRAWSTWSTECCPGYGLGTFSARIPLAPSNLTGLIIKILNYGSRIPGLTSNINFHAAVREISWFCWVKYQSTAKESKKRTCPCPSVERATTRGLQNV